MNIPLCFKWGTNFYSDLLGNVMEKSRWPIVAIIGIVFTIVALMIAGIFVITSGFTFMEEGAQAPASPILLLAGGLILTLVIPSALAVHVVKKLSA